GESGTGKGELARSIHAWSGRASRPCVTINCPSLSAELMESELFGHTRGAYTGAVESTLGRVSQADGGTLFLDEIGDFPLPLQSKLLRFIQDKEYERVGDPVTRRADVRILAATNHSLDTMVRAGRFREDLLYRLNVITLTIPPLRERPEDVLPLAERFLMQFVKSYGRPARALSAEARRLLSEYAWPGNVRELRNVIERASIICTQEYVEVSHLGLTTQPGSGAPRVGETLSLEALEKAHIAALIASSEPLDQAAAILAIAAAKLYRERKHYGLYPTMKLRRQLLIGISAVMVVALIGLGIGVFSVLQMAREQRQFTHYHYSLLTIAQEMRKAIGSQMTLNFGTPQELANVATLRQDFARQLQQANALVRTRYDRQLVNTIAQAHDDYLQEYYSLLRADPEQI